MRAGHEKRAVDSGTQPRLVLGALAAIAIQLALIASWAGAMKSPALHEQPIGLVLTASSQPSASDLRIGPGDAISWRPLTDAASAQRVVRHGDLAAALVVGAGKETLYLASGGGPITATAISAVIGAQARAAHLDLRIADLLPPQSGDPRTLGLFVLILGWVVGGLAGALLLSRSHGKASRSVRGALTLLGAEAGYAVAASALGVVLVDPALRMMTGHAAELLAVGSLFIFAIAAFATALLAVFGSAGIALAVAGLVIVGNPVSGAMVPAGMLPSAWHFLSAALPNTAGVHLVRAVTYFGSRGIAGSLVVLAVYAGISLVIVLGLAVRGQLRTARSSPTEAGSERVAVTASAGMGG